MPMRLIGLSGKAGHGKDTVADILQATHAVRKVAFADALKRDMFWALIGADNDNPYYRRYLENNLPPVAFINSIKHLPEVRLLLQAYGQALRAGDENYWIKRLFSKLLHDTLYAVTDVRYPNEANAIRSAGGIMVRVTRQGYNNGLTELSKAHPSEVALDDYEYFDTFMENDGNLEQLTLEVRDNFVIQRYLRRGETQEAGFGNDADDLTLA